MAAGQVVGTHQLRVIAPRVWAVRMLLGALGFVTALGAGIAWLVLRSGDQTMAGTRLLGTGLVMAFAGIFFFGLVLLFAINTRLMIGADRVGYRNPIGRTRFWSRGEIARVVEMAVSYSRLTQSNYGIYFFGLGGERLLLLAPFPWNAAELREFIEASGAPFERRLAPVRVRDAAREFPRAFSWGSQHIWLMSIALMVGIIAVVVVYAVVAAALKSA